MMNLHSGNITIDGVDTSTLSPEDIRLSLNVLPQRPFLIPGTLRDNVDPLGQVSNDDVVEALHLVGLWETVFQDLPDGIDSPMPGQMLSHGQKQLLCLARALMRARHSPVLVLDEATSSVDLETEHRMQELIHEQFECKTVIAIAHRLDTILDFDAVMVMDGGRIAEWGEPRSLLTRDSLFNSLYHETVPISPTGSSHDGSIYF
jgi:ATP-binding cassette subfamily C (CFTR/MRP) protein 1